MGSEQFWCDKELNDSLFLSTIEMINSLTHSVVASQIRDMKPRINIHPVLFNLVSFKTYEMAKP